MLYIIIFHSMVADSHDGHDDDDGWKETLCILSAGEGSVHTSTS